MNGVLEFLGSALVGTGKAGSVGFEIDLHVTAGRDVARFLVVGKIVPVNLVEAGGVFAVKHDADVVQFGAAVQLELLEIAGLDGEQRAFAVGLGELKAGCGLLDVDADFVGKLFQHIAQAHARIEICPRHHRDKEHSDDGQPAAEAVDGERHTGFSLIDSRVAASRVSSTDLVHESGQI